MSKAFKHLRRFLLAFLGAALISPAYAAVLFTIERVDDTHGRLIGTGTLGTVAPSANDYILGLTNPFATEPVTDESVNALVSTTLQVGAAHIDFAQAASSVFDLYGNGTPSFFFGTYASFLPGALVSGYIDLELIAGATFAAAGTSGLVTWGVMDFADPQVIGEWIIVAPASDVPEPGNLALGAIALAALLAARRRTRS